MTIQLNDRKVFPIGLGTWKMGGTHERDDSHDQEDIAAIRYALAHGVNFINGAEVYGAGHTDELIGKAAAGFDDVILASKLKKETLARPETIRSVVKTIARRLGRPAVDLLYVHWPFPEADMDAYLSEMFVLQDEGMVHAIGVSNFNLTQLKYAQDIAVRSGHRIAAIENVFSINNRGGGIHPATDLVQPGFTPALQKYCREHDILMVAYTPTDKGRVSNHPVVREIAKARKVSPIQVALAWLIQQDIVPIVKSSQPTHIDENLGSLSVHLSDQEMARLGATTPLGEIDPGGRPAHTG